MKVKLKAYPFKPAINLPVLDKTGESVDVRMCNLNRKYEVKKGREAIFSCKNINILLSPHSTQLFY